MISIKFQGKNELKIATDCNAYTFKEFQSEIGEWAEWCWERAWSVRPGQHYVTLSTQVENSFHSPGRIQRSGRTTS